MNTTELLNNLPGITLIDTIAANNSLLLSLGCLIALAVAGIIMAAVAEKTRNVVCTIVSCCLGVTLLAGCCFVLRDCKSANIRDKYIVEIADDAPLSSMMVLTQNFKTLEIDGNTYTLARK